MMKIIRGDEYDEHADDEYDYEVDEDENVYNDDDKMMTMAPISG